MVAAREADAKAYAAWEEETADLKAELEAIEVEAAKIIKTVPAARQSPCQRLQQSHATAAGSARLGTPAVLEKAATFEPDLPDRPEPAEAEADESAWLFSSERGYMEQIGHYQRHKNGG